MLDYLYPRIYFSPDGDEEGGGEDSDYGSDENGGVDNGGGVYESEDELVAEDIIEPYAIPTTTEYVNVSAIPGTKSITSFLMPSSDVNPFIGGFTEGSIPSQGLEVLVYILGNPGGKFYLNIKDIDDDKIFDLSNTEIPASGRYATKIAFPASTTTNKYKINLRAGDGSILSPSLPKTDPMWTIHQYPNPTATFTKTTGTATGVTYSGDDVTFTTNPKISLNARTNAHQSTSLKNGNSIPTYSTFTYAITAAKGGALVYVKNTSFEIANDTTLIKKVKEDVVDSNIIKLENVDNLSNDMVAELSNYTKTKLYNVNSLTLKLSDTSNLYPGMFISGGANYASIVSIKDGDEITISNDISASDKTVLTFYHKFNTTLTIKSIDTYLKRITLLGREKRRINAGTLLSFKNDEMRFARQTATSNSGSASTTITNTIIFQKFGTKDVTFTFPTDDIFTLTPNASDQRVSVVKETAKDINVLLPDTDNNSGSKTPSTVRNPVHGVISGSYGSGDGTITYTPAVGFVGEDSFTFKVNDGTTDSEVKTIFITVKK